MTDFFERHWIRLGRVANVKLLETEGLEPQDVALEQITVGDIRIIVLASFKTLVKVIRKVAVRHEEEHESAD